MGLADRRKIKTFTEVVTKTFTPTHPGSDQGAWKLDNDTPIDEQVNQWVEKEGAVILQVSPSWSQMQDPLKDGRLVRRAIMRYVVVYTDEEEYFESEAKVRKMAMLGDTSQPVFVPAAIQEAEPALPPPVLMEPPNPVVSNAGGPPGIETLDSEDGSFFRGASNV